MPVDLGVFERQKSIIDQQQLQDAFELKKALAIQEAQKSAQTQDLNAQLKLLALQGQQEQRDINRQKQSQSPSTAAIDTYNFVRGLPEEERKLFFQTQRGEPAPVIKDVGGGFGVFNRDTGTFAPIPGGGKGLTPEQLYKNQTDLDVKNKGIQDFEDGLSNLFKYYNRLDELGAITSESKGEAANLMASAGASDIGQFIGGKLGSEAQSTREKIKSVVPTLAQNIKTATGMSAQQMNSNFELQSFLKVLGNEKSTIEANKEAIKNLSEMFGSGEVAQSIGGDSNPVLPVPSGAVPQAMPPGAGFTPPPLGNLPVQMQQGASSFKEGATATNPRTGQKLTYRNGQWQ
jgi:hypothetical protein